jgi:hypothetical protein
VLQAHISGHSKFSPHPYLSNVTPRSIGLPDKLMVARLVKKFPSFCRTTRKKIKRKTKEWKERKLKVNNE